GVRQNWGPIGSNHDGAAGNSVAGVPWRRRDTHPPPSRVAATYAIFGRSFRASLSGTTVPSRTARGMAECARTRRSVGVLDVQNDGPVHDDAAIRIARRRTERVAASPGRAGHQAQPP